MNEDFIVRMIDEKLVVVNINDAKYYTLNEIGNLILDHIVNSKTYHELWNAVHDRFEISEEDFRKDMDQFLKKLEKKSIIKINSEI